MEEKLNEFLKNGKDWARANTSLEGVCLLKLPAYRGQQAKLAVEVNPVDEEERPIKKRGLMLRCIEELEAFKKLLAQEKLAILLQNIEKVCGKPAKRAQREVIELV